MREKNCIYSQLQIPVKNPLVQNIQNRVTLLFARSEKAEEKTADNEKTAWLRCLRSSDFLKKQDLRQEKAFFDILRRSLFDSPWTKGGLSFFGSYPQIRAENFVTRLSDTAATVAICTKASPAEFFKISFPGRSRADLYWFDKQNHQSLKISEKMRRPYFSPKNGSVTLNFKQKWKIPGHYFSHYMVSFSQNCHRISRKTSAPAAS